MAKVLSIEISNSVIRMCQMDFKKTNPRVYRHAMADTPQGSYMDGRILKPELLKDVIVDALKENKMHHTKDVVFSISSSKIVTREVMLPAIKEKLIPNMIKANLGEYFPIDLTAYEVDHLILEKIEEGQDAGKYKVLIMAAEKHMMKSYEELASACGLRLTALDYAGNSIFQAIRNEDESSRVMILKIEEKSTTVTIVNHKNLMLQRAINYGINDAIDEITKNRVFNVGNYDEAWALAKRKACIKYWLNEDKERTSVDLSTRLENRDFDESQEIREAKIEVTKSLEQLISSIRRVIEFYSSRNNGESVDQILIGGCAGDINGLARLFSNEFGIKATVLNRMEGVGWHVVGDDAGIYNYISCIGAAINPIGFYSREKKAAETEDKDYTSVTIMTVVAVAIACAGILLLGKMGYNDAVEEEAFLLEQKAQFEAAKLTFDQYNKVLSLHGQVAAGNNMTKHTNDNILKFLEELENALPANVLISSFKSDDKTVVFSLRVDDKETAAGVIANIRNFGSLMSVSVPSISETEQLLDAKAYADYLTQQREYEKLAAAKAEERAKAEAEANGGTTVEGEVTDGTVVEGEVTDGTAVEGEVVEEEEEEEIKVPAHISELRGAEIPENVVVSATGELAYKVKYVSFNITGVYYPATVISK